MVHEEEKREQWGNKIDFILSCLGYAVGLGNVWRFPYLCGQNGGAGFMIPYFIMMIFAGFPTFYMELAIGQYAALTPHLLYRRMCPIFTGIGHAMIASSVFTGIYYNMIIAWSVRYFVASFSFSKMPWEGCDNDWNICYDDIVATNCTTDQWYFRGECRSNLLTSVQVGDETTTRSEAETLLAVTKDPETGDPVTKRLSPSKEYNKYILGESDGLEYGGLPKWDLVLCLLFSWILVFFCLIRGVKSSGKVVYFTATFPYVILLILLIRGATLDGAWEGVKYYIVPDFSHVIKSGTWVTAAIQIFFSLSLGGGGLTTLASYNEFNNNLLRDTLIVVLGNCGTSVFAGFVIFPIIGFMAKQTGQAVETIAASGPTLAFVAYPDALARIHPSWFWSLLFFFMLVLLGIDSQLVIVEVVITSICDNWPHLRKPILKIAVVGGVCFVSFLLGIMLCCPNGTYILTLMDTFAAGWVLVLACLAEICMVSWVYGIKRFIKDIDLMMGRAPSTAWKVLGYPTNWYWWICWALVTPILLGLVLIMSWVQYERTTAGEYLFPIWGELIGWAITIACMIWIPLFAIINVIKAARDNSTTGAAKWRWLIEPTEEWRPAAPQEPDTFNMRPISKDAGQTNPAYATERSGQLPPLNYNAAHGTQTAYQPYKGQNYA